VAAVDWWAVQFGRRDVERWAKPLTMMLLVGVAATWGEPAGDVRAWLVVGAVLGVVGDVALLDTGETAFLVGLSSFAVGHLAYAVAAISFGFDPLWMLPGLAVMAGLLGFRFLTRTVAGARRAGGAALAGAVVFYAAVISAMVLAAWGTGLVVAAVGATCFAVSDWVLGHRRFAGPLPGGRLAIMVPYHVGQALLIVGLAAG
jgi:uncharacterized membrane protein YhhN